MLEQLKAEILIDHLEGYLTIKDEVSRYIRSNHNAAKLFGFSNPDQMENITDYELNCPAAENAESFIENDEKVLKNAKVQRYLDIYTYADGKLHVLYTIKKPLFNNSQVTGLLCQAIDINPQLVNAFDDGILSLGKRKDNTGYSYSICEAVDDYGLSPTESKVLFYLLRGYSTKMIAASMTRSARTIEHHNESIRIKMNCENRDQLIELAHQKGLANILPMNFLRHHRICSLSSN